MLALSLAACGSSGGDAKNTSGSQQSGQTEKNKESEQAEESNSGKVLVDESGIKITAKSLETKKNSSPELKLLIENESGKDLTFQCRNASVNGYMVGTTMSADVVNGKKVNDSLTFSRSDMELCGISEIADMEFSFHIFTSDNWDTFLDTAPVTCKTSLAETYEYTYDASGNTVYEGNGIKIVSQGLTEDSFWGPAIKVYIENTGDKNVTIQARDVSVNGFMADPIFSCDIVPGKHAVDTITFSSSDLKENDISTINDVELSFHIYDMNSWDAIEDTDIITLSF